MRYLLIFWALPIGLFWGWYHLSLNDMHFGLSFFSREMHDLVFAVYGKILGIAPDKLPPLVARACVVDTIILLGIFAFRRRRVIREWLAGRRQRYPREEESVRSA